MTNNKSYCFVPTCKATTDKYANISFHQFPKEGANFVKYETKLGIMEKIDRHKLWLLKLKLKKIVRCAKICSLHFRPEDFFTRHANSTKRKFLKNIAVPSLNLPFENKNARTINGRIQRLDARNANKEEKKQPIEILNLQQAKGKSSKNILKNNFISNKRIKTPVHFDIPPPPLLYFGTRNINRVSLEPDIEIEENKPVISEIYKMKEEIKDPLTNTISPINTSVKFEFVSVTPKIENCCNDDQSEIVLINL